MIEFIRRWFWEREFRELFRSDIVLNQGIDLFVFGYDEDYNCHRMSIDYREKRYCEVIYNHLRGNGAIDAVNIIMSILVEYDQNKTDA